MNLQTIITNAVQPALQIIGVKDTPEARVMLLSIGLQESRFLHRKQIGGPARGFWQFEQGGGLVGVLSLAVTKKKARALCDAREVSPVAADVYYRLEHDDVLAAGFARLLLLTDPRPLPQLGDEQGAWAYYLRNWRPGKPHPDSWPLLYQKAMDAV